MASRVTLRGSATTLSLSLPCLIDQRSYRTGHCSRVATIVAKCKVSLEAIDHVDRLYRNGCSTSEDLFWKLDALQSFIHDLHWPDAEFARHLEQRLKLMACDMIESCIQRSVVPLKLSLPPADMLDLWFL